MNLVNFPNIRIKEYLDGWVVEIQKTKWYGKKYWVHIIPVYGIWSKPWYFKTYESAINEATKLFKRQLAN